MTSMINQISAKKRFLEDSLNCGLILIFLAFNLLLFGFNCNAQPSDASILQKLKSDNSNPLLISTKITGQRGAANKDVENGYEVTNFYRSYEAKLNTEYPGVTRIYRSMVKYGYRGGSWKYLQSLVGDNTYHGIPNPTWAELETLLTSNWKETLGYDYTQIVGEIEDLALTDDPDWVWHTMSSVSFNISMKYSKKINNTDLETVQQTYRIRLYAENYKDPWNEDFLSSSEKKVSLGTQTYTSQELKDMRTLKEMDIEKRTNAEIANLPEIEIPEYANHAQLMLHFHTLLMTADGPTIEAYLRKMLTSGYFDPNMKQVLNTRGADLINNTVEISSRYRNQYCEDPQLKHTQDNMNEWFNKNASSYSRVSSSNFGNGVRGISEISLSVVSVGSSQEADLTAMTCTVRSNPLTRMRATTLNSVMGAYVFSRYGSSEWSYIGQIAGSASNGYKIKWMDGSTSNEPTASVCNYELIPGDVVYMKNSSGQIVAKWITKNEGTTVVEVEDLGGNVISVHVKDLRFK